MQELIQLLINMNRAASVISYILHPLWAPTAGIFILTHSGTYVADLNENMKNLIYLVIATLTFVIPVCMIPLYFYFKIIRNVEITRRRERLLPLYITLISYIAAYILIKRLPVSQLYGRFIFSSCMALLIVIVITHFWQISAHMTALGGLAGLVIVLSKKLGADLMLYLLLLLLLSGIAGSARLKLNAHSSGQVYSGYLIGFSAVYFLMMI